MGRADAEQGIAELAESKPLIEKTGDQPSRTSWSQRFMVAGTVAVCLLALGLFAVWWHGRSSPERNQPDGYTALAEARKQRTAMYDGFVKVYDALRTKNVPIFPRNGFLIMVVRDGGLAKWDIDIDMAILDMACGKLRGAVDAVAETGATLTVSADCTVWRINHPDLNWPLMDGVVLKTTDNLVHFPDVDEASDRAAQTRGFPLEDWDATHEWERFDFYCQSIGVPRGYETYLAAHYSGDEWRKVAVNKCSEPNGPLYRNHPEKCRAAACYLGAPYLPVASRPGPTSRGAIDSKTCSGFETEQEFTEEDEALAKEYSKKELPWALP